MAVSLILLTLSCARKDAGKGLVKLSGRNSGELTLPGFEDEPGFDSTFFIGYVDYFTDTREFYTTLFYREGREYPDDDLLESKLDSVIVFDEDWGRERLPFEEAKKLLVLSGLDTLLIFNRRNEPICRCPLKRVEYLWNGMESYFVAVFTSPSDFSGQSEELYGISAEFPDTGFESFYSEELTDTAFNEFLIKKLKISPARDWDMRHYRITPHEAMYSIMSSYSMDLNEGRSYLTYFEKNRARILNEEQDNYHFLNILPIPVHVNGMPLLLISAGYPSSDVMWDYLAKFDGNRYEAIDYNRVHLNELSPRWPVVLSQAATH